VAPIVILLWALIVLAVIKLDIATIAIIVFLILFTAVVFDIIYRQEKRAR